MRGGTTGQFKDPEDDEASLGLLGAQMVIAQAPPPEPGINLVSAVEVMVLRALGSMAGATSIRHQGEVLLALKRAGSAMTSGAALSALRNLERAGLVVGLIMLDDGGVVATLTPLALAALR